MQYCEEGQSPTVQVAALGNTQRLSFGNAPIDVEKVSSDNQGKTCWHVWVSSTRGVYGYDFLGCAKSASLAPDPSLPFNGCWVELDGVNSGVWMRNDQQNGFTANCQPYKPDQPPSGVGTIGNCSSCSTDCTLTVSDAISGATIWTQSYGCDCSQINYSVACSGCLSTECQIDCSTYPGYCCIDKAFIYGLMAQLKSQ